MASRSIEGLARGSPTHRHPCQLLDSSATSVLGTVRRLGYLQLDPISTVAPATAPRRFWDFRYRLEMYVPKAKREHELLRPSPPRRRPTRRPRRTPLRPQDPHPPPPRRLGRHLAPSSTKQYRRSARAGSRVHLILRAQRMPAPLGKRPFAGAPPLCALRPLLDTIFPFRQDAVGRWQAVGIQHNPARLSICRTAHPGFSSYG